MTVPTAEQVSIPLQAQGRLRELVFQWQRADQSLKIYMQALTDALVLEGEWQVDVKQMVIKRQDKKTTGGEIPGL